MIDSLVYSSNTLIEELGGVKKAIIGIPEWIPLQVATLSSEFRLFLAVQFLVETSQKHSL